MTTEELVKRLRNYMPSGPLAQSLMEEAADSLEELQQKCNMHYNTICDLAKERNALNKQLEQAVLERTPHDYGILKEEAQEMRKQRDEARAEVERLKDKVRKWKFDANSYVEWINKLKTEVEQLKQINSETEWKVVQTVVRGEPSRLEIATMIYAAFAGAQCIKDKVNPTAFIAVKCAEELIAAEKEGK